MQIAPARLERLRARARRARFVLTIGMLTINLSRGHKHRVFRDLAEVKWRLRLHAWRDEMWT